ncbi:4Fe-4S dicluster domain-containing protein, partial [Eggerthella lenta]
MAACFHRHDVPNDVAVPRLTLVTTRTISAPVGCHHCAEAPCVDACPTGCLFTDDEHVGVHPDKCIGCRNCVLACPYGAVEIVTEKLPPEPEAASGTEAAAASAQTLLCCQAATSRHPQGLHILREGAVGLSGDVALEAADGVLL